MIMLKKIIVLIFCLLSVQMNAKTVYYVKSGATGSGSSWSDASGSIQDMIDRASVGDEVWVAEGTFYPISEEYGCFSIQKEVSVYGGFEGTEKEKNERVRIDRNKNGKIEKWEFLHETILSGDIDGIPDIWEYDDKQLIWEVKGMDHNYQNSLISLISSYPYSFSQNVYISGFTCMGAGRCDVVILESNSIMEECEVYHNLSAISIIALNRNGLLRDCYIHDNYVCDDFSASATVYNCSTVMDCIVADNVVNKGRNGAFDGTSRFATAGGIYNVEHDGRIFRCIIKNNVSTLGGGVMHGECYECNLQNNIALQNGGGSFMSNLYNCVLSENKAYKKGGGSYYGNLYNCEIKGNFSQNGGGVYGESTSSLADCSIFNNKAGTSGGGVWNDGRCYNCDVYNNYAPAYGGVASDGYYTNCTIANNKSFSGNENNGSLTNCILVGSFEGYASYSIFTDSYISGAGNFLVTLKEIKFRRPTSFIGNAANDKQLEELKKADFGLSEGSSAIDMGRQDVNQALPVEDISGYPRPMGEKTDIGAHEFLSFRPLPYENNFDEKIPSINSGRWTVDKLPGKDNNYWYTNESSYVTTTFFAKTVSNKINLSFDFAGKYAKKNQQEKMHVVLAYLESDKRDTIMTISNIDYIRDSHFSKEISPWVKNKVFRVLFAVEKSEGDNIVYCGIANLKITKQDASVEIVAEDKVCMYDGKSHTVEYQINDTRVDKRKAVVTYRKEGETSSTTTPPTNAGIYMVQISIEDGSYYGMKEVKLTIEKANQTIQWTQQLRTMKAKERIRLEATATSGLPVTFSSGNETIAKVEQDNGEWWLVADTLPGEAIIKAFQLGNENYNLANSVLKTIRVEAVPTDVESIVAEHPAAYFVKAENYIYVKGLYPKSKLFLYDPSGRLCLSKEVGDIESHISVDGLGKGLYYLQVVSSRDKRDNFKVLIY
ncbi:choice-of-anchor Q domain-containing protein [Parabacteroides johnsonii]|jgi:immunoglobulin I-set domain protein|uniref:choice-of-anchor Q domain-containing protein n=1 Tax=Parabacteroides johnsonii TaxID=387661 RepID=UPI003AB785F3